MASIIIGKPKEILEVKSSSILPERIVTLGVSGAFSHAQY